MTKTYKLTIRVQNSYWFQHGWFQVSSEESSSIYCGEPPFWQNYLYLLLLNFYVFLQFILENKQPWKGMNVYQIQTLEHEAYFLYPPEFLDEENVPDFQTSLKEIIYFLECWGSTQESVEFCTTVSQGWHVWVSRSVCKILHYWDSGLGVGK